MCGLRASLTLTRACRLRPRVPWNYILQLRTMQAGRWPDRGGGMHQARRPRVSCRVGCRARMVCDSARGARGARSAAACFAFALSFCTALLYAAGSATADCVVGSGDGCPPEARCSLCKCDVISGECACAACDATAFSCDHDCSWGATSRCEACTCTTESCECDSCVSRLTPTVIFVMVLGSLLLVLLVTCACRKRCRRARYTAVSAG